MFGFLQAICAESPEWLRLSPGARPAKAGPHHRQRASLSQRKIDHPIAIVLQDMKRGLLEADRVSAGLLKG